MAAKISETARSTIAIMRARARLGAAKKPAKKGTRRRSSGGGRSGFFGTGALGNVSLFEAGSIAVLGGVTLGSVLRLPAWLSPIGAALWLYGMWRGNAVLKSLGLLLVALGVVDVLGIPAAIASRVKDAQAKGVIPSFLGGAPAPASDTGRAPTALLPSPVSDGRRRGASGTDLDNVIRVAEDVVSTAERAADLVSDVRTAFA